MKKNLKIIIPVAIIVVLAIVGTIIFKSNSGKSEIKMSKEEMLEKAEILKFSELKSAMSENQMRAKEEYIGKIYKFDGFVNTVTDKYVSLENGDISNFNVYLNKKELSLLSKGQAITVVGKLVNTENNNYELKNAYFVSDRIDIILATVDIATSLTVRYNSIKGKNEVVDRTDKVNDWYCKLLKGKDTYYLDECIPVEDRGYCYMGKPDKELTTVRGKKIASLYGVTLIGARVEKDTNGKAMIKDFEEIEVITSEQIKKWGK